MPFTSQERNEIAEIAGAAWDEMRRKRLDAAQQQPKPEMTTKIYLITLMGHQIAFPDADGRAIHSQSFYARVDLPKERPSFFSGSVEVVAWGDGKMLPAPMTAILTGSSIVALVEAPEGVVRALTAGA